jgi:tRNA wybutosine-synthesizing protein 2
VNRAIVVHKKNAEYAKNKLLACSALDDRRKITRYDDVVEIPVLRVPDDLDVPYRCVRQRAVRPRESLTPFEQICCMLSDMPEKERGLLPKKWEKFGDVLVVKMVGIPRTHKLRVAKAYARVLGCTTVLEEIGGIHGRAREPHVAFLLGDSAETVHVENGVRFAFDAAALMFSSGNVDERMRMATVAAGNDTVVDLFAGIGYFTLPMAVHAGALVYACEINPVAHGYLKRNCVLNDVASRVTPLLGDCRDIAPKNVASRVVMGHFDALSFLPTAFAALRQEGGTLHVHVKCAEERFPAEPMNRIAAGARDHRKNIRCASFRTVKSYAPHIIHGVLNVTVA